MRRVLLAAAVVSAAVALVAPPAGADGDVSASIVGGVVETREQPFVVSLVFKSGGGSAVSRTYCGGALVAPRYVVTAGHCVAWPDRDDSQVSPFDIAAVKADTTVVIGRNVLSSGSGDRRTIESIIPEPSYTQRAGLPRWDVAVIRLSSASTKTPIPIATTANTGQWANGKTVQVFGHGVTDPNDSASASNELKRTRLTVVGQHWAVDTFAAAPFGGSDCYGDSGGPVTVGGYPSFKLIGLVSNGPPDCAGTSLYSTLAADARPGATSPLRTWVLAQVR